VRPILSSLAIALPLWILAGLVEATWLWSRGLFAFGGARALTAAALLHGILGLAAGLAVAGAARLPVLGRRLGTAAELLAAHAALLLVWTAGAVLNVRVLPDAWSPPSLLANALLLFLALPAAALLLHRPAGLLLAGCGRRPRLALAGLLALWALLPLTAAAGAARTAAPPPPVRPGLPNVLVLLVDTLRADHLGCYGYSRDTSPHLDRLAAGGVLFAECLASAPHTKPSTATILTGLEPPTHRVERIASRLAPEATTLHELLHAAGYHTALVSANSFVSRIFGFGDGVDFYRGAMDSPVSALLAWQVLDRLHDTWVESLRLPAAPWLLLLDLVNSPFDLSEDRRGLQAAGIQEEFLGWLDGLPKAAPWFAWLHYMEPHTPYAPAPAHRLFGNPEDPEAATWHPQPAAGMFLPFRPGPELPAAERGALLANYDGCIHEVDAAIGALLEKLWQRGLLDDTLVVLTSDHGEEFHDHGAWGHGHSLHRELLRVPLVMRWPGRLPAGRRVSERVRSVDLYPTLADLLGLQPPPGLAGRSLLPLLDGSESGDREAFAEVEWGGQGAMALRGTAGTVIRARDGGRTVVQAWLAEDRAEKRPVEVLQGALERLHQHLLQRRDELAAVALQALEAHVAEGTRADLEALGYVDGD